MSAALRAWGPAVVWAAAIFFASSRPSLPVELELGLDKAAHFATFAVLGVALAHGQHRSGWPWASAVALGLGYGAFDELHQSFVPGRLADAGDWIADAFGTVVGVLLFHAWRRRRPGGSRRRPGVATHSAPS